MAEAETVIPWQVNDLVYVDGGKEPQKILGIDHGTGLLVMAPEDWLSNEDRANPRTIRYTQIDATIKKGEPPCPLCRRLLVMGEGYGCDRCLETMTPGQREWFHRQIGGVEKARGGASVPAPPPADLGIPSPLAAKSTKTDLAAALNRGSAGSRGDG